MTSDYRHKNTQVLNICLIVCSSSDFMTKNKKKYQQCDIWLPEQMHQLKNYWENVKVNSQITVCSIIMNNTSQLALQNTSM